MKPPIFVFTDDLDIFETPDAVLKYFEPWIHEEPREAFDAQGRILNFFMHPTPKKLWRIFAYAEETQKLEATADFDSARLISLLRDHFKDNLEMSSVINQFGNSSGASIQKIAETAALIKGYTR